MKNTITLKEYMLNWIEKVYNDNIEKLSSEYREDDKEYIENYLQKYKNSNDFDFTSECFYFLENYDSMRIHSFMETLKKQLQFDLENTYTGKEENENLGYFNIDGNEYIFIGSGGDWEFPIHYIIFLRNDELCGYVPRKGNLFNHLNNSAIGNDEDLDEEAGFDEDKMDKIQAEDKYPDFDLLNKEIKEMFNTLNNIKKYSTDELKLELYIKGFTNLKRTSKSKIDGNIRRLFQNEEVQIEVITNKEDNTIISINEGLSKKEQEKKDRKEKEKNDYLQRVKEGRAKKIAELQNMDEEKFKTLLLELFDKLDKDVPQGRGKYTFIKRYDYLDDVVQSFGQEIKDLYFGKLAKYKEEFENDRSPITISMSDFLGMS